MGLLDSLVDVLLTAAAVQLSLLSDSALSIVAYRTHESRRGPHPHSRTVHSSVRGHLHRFLLYLPTSLTQSPLLLLSHFFSSVERIPGQSRE